VFEARCPPYHASMDAAIDCPCAAIARGEPSHSCAAPDG
jgi:hypothetical protein